MNQELRSTTCTVVSYKYCEYRRHGPWRHVLYCKMNAYCSTTHNQLLLGSKSLHFALLCTSLLATRDQEQLHSFSRIGLISFQSKSAYRQVLSSTTMGKQSKRKNKGKGKGKDKPTLPQQEVDTGGSTVLQRLRHADARTRHAALAALATTVLDPESLGKRQVKLDLLQAIRERVMDDDLECAQAAAGCLANYISYGQQENHMEVTASWTVVLMQRLKTCAEQLKNQPTNRWLALTMQCLHALCSLIETNMHALDRLTKNNACPTILSLIQCGTIELERNQNVVSTSPPRDVSLLENMVTYAARTLHSALDDNLELLNLWMTTDPSSWSSIQASCRNQALPIACRLHCAGCLVTARLLSGDEALQSAVITDAIPLLHSMLELNVQSSLVEHYMECHKKWLEEEADGNLEREAIQAVNRRREPARSIARRQKEMKAEKMKAEQTIMDDNEKADDGMDSDGKQVPQEGEDAREALEKARDAWHNAVEPLELALEILANLTSLGPQHPTMEGVNTDGGWDPEDETMMIAQHEEMEEVTLSPLDDALIRAVVAAQIPSRLVSLLKNLCEPLPQNILPDAKEDIVQVQSKCAACLGNCVGEHFPNWTEGLLQELRLALEASNGNPSIANALTAALKSRAELRKQCEAPELELLFRLASSSPCQKEAVEMMGILCSMEPHPEEVNRKVCHVLMSITSKKSAVINEILNALMDIYGDDGCHPSVFSELGVLEYFRRAIPSFKKVIQCDRDEASVEEVEQWQETALNASRFVSYKKGRS